VPAGAAPWCGVTLLLHVSRYRHLYHLICRGDTRTISILSYSRYLNGGFLPEDDGYTSPYGSNFVIRVPKELKAAQYLTEAAFRLLNFVNVPSPVSLINHMHVLASNICLCFEPGNINFETISYVLLLARNLLLSMHGLAGFIFLLPS
jgi:hypothetical protein